MPGRDAGSSHLYCFIWIDRILTRVSSTDKCYECILREMSWKTSADLSVQTFLVYSLVFDFHSGRHILDITPPNCICLLYQ